MLLPAEMPQSGRDEEDNVESPETVRNILAESKMARTVDLYIGGDINIHTIEWYGMYGHDRKKKLDYTIWTELITNEIR